MGGGRRGGGVGSADGVVWPCVSLIYIVHMYLN